MISCFFSGSHFGEMAWCLMAESTWDSLRHETGTDGEMSREMGVRVSERVHLLDNVRWGKVKWSGV